MEAGLVDVKPEITAEEEEEPVHALDLRVSILLISISAGKFWDF
jgi:hypothetical protein